MPTDSTKWKILHAEEPTDFTPDEVDWEWYEQAAWYAAKLYYQAAEYSQDLRDLLVEAYESDSNDWLDDIHELTKEADEATYEEIQGLKLSALQGGQAVQLAGRVIANEDGMPRRSDVVDELQSGDRDAIDDADRVETVRGDVRAIHLALNGSIEVHFEYDHGVESTPGGQVLEIDIYG